MPIIMHRPGAPGHRDCGNHDNKISIFPNDESASIVVRDTAAQVSGFHMRRTVPGVYDARIFECHERSRREWRAVGVASARR
jgi:hypothetical protein